MIIREPILAGRAYPGDPRACRAAVEALLAEAAGLRDGPTDLETGGGATSTRGGGTDASAGAGPDGGKAGASGSSIAGSASSAPGAARSSAAGQQGARAPAGARRRILGGLVPHDPWTRSGAIAARVLQEIAAERQPDVIVLFGGVQRYRGQEAAMFGSGRWQTPLGGMSIDTRLAERVVGQTSLILDDPYAHEEEPTLEVQIPLLQHLFPQARMLPIMVPPRAVADEVGEAVARTLLSYRYDAVILGATNLSAVGGSRSEPPGGRRRAGPEPSTGGKFAGSEPFAGGPWGKTGAEPSGGSESGKAGAEPPGAKQSGTAGPGWPGGGAQESDRRFIDLACAMRASSLVIEALERKNATCSGAAAAATAACRTLGARRGVLLAYARSESGGEPGRPSSGESAGYAGIVFS